MSTVQYLKQKRLPIPSPMVWQWRRKADSQSLHLAWEHMPCSPDTQVHQGRRGGRRIDCDAAKLMALHKTTVYNRLARIACALGPSAASSVQRNRYLALLDLKTKLPLPRGLPLPPRLSSRRCFLEKSIRGAEKSADFYAVFFHCV